MTAMPTDPDRLDQLRTRVQDAASRFSDPVAAADADPESRRLDFAAWWLLASRLAALGEDEPFRTWPALAGQLEIDAVEALREAATTGITVLGDGAGEPLAEALIDAEDAACLREAESRCTGLLPGLAPVIEAWMLAASAAVLDADAAEIVREHAEAWPVPASIRLPAVQTPLSDVEVLAAFALGEPTRAMRLAPVFEFEEAAALFHDGRPSEAMQARFAERAGDGVTPSGAMIRVLPRLDAYWCVAVEIVGEAARRVRTVRLGTWPLQRVDPRELGLDDETGGEPVVIFEAAMAAQPLDLRMRLVASDIGVTTDDGGRFLL
ncbi:MAG: hypothetical protein RLZZ461_114 [Planctomycetota bacterium]|jgi:hypothetical protein